MERIHATDQAILELLEFFIPLCNDVSTMKEVREIAADPNKWGNGHKLFNVIRKKTLESERKSDTAMTHQYLFEEICSKTLYNLSNPQDPFDSDSSFWVLPIAIQFAAEIGIDKPTRCSSLLRE